MKNRRSFLWLLFALALVHLNPLNAQSLADLTVVVYNQSVPESVALAKFYAQQRGIPRDHLVGLSCLSDEEISRAEYDDHIAFPLRETFKKRGWWLVKESLHQSAVIGGSIHFVALIKGIPLKIRAEVDYPGDQKGPAPIGERNEASVDSELAMLGAYTHQISGFASNPYFQSYRPISEFDAAPLLLVCRLDAPSGATVRRMIVDSIAAEKNGLWGRAYVDGARNIGTGLVIGDQWLRQIPDQLRKVGVPVVYENTPEIFPDTYPMTDCALYYGWYTANVAGVFARPDFRFVPGAVAVHIHSFSASTLRDPNADWAGPLVTKGAAATVGNVYEPYLQLTAELQILNDRLLHGFTFGESAYMSMKALSWMGVMVGDPLYRPYASWLQIEPQREPAKNLNDWKTYHDFVVRNIERNQSEFRVSARQAAMRTRNGPMMEDLGLIEAREEHFAAAANNFQLARTYYTKRDDLVRVVLEESDAWINLKKPSRALELVRSTLRVSPDSPAAPLLRAIEREASEKPPISPTPKS